MPLLLNHAGAHWSEFLLRAIKIEPGNKWYKEQYAILLEEEAFPFEDKATKLHELNHVRLRDGIYDDWVKRSIGSLAQLLPSQYERVEFAETYVN